MAKGDRRPRPIRHALVYLLAYALLATVLLLRGEALRVTYPAWYAGLVLVLVTTGISIYWLGTRSSESKLEPVAIFSVNAAGLVSYFALAHKFAGLTNAGSQTSFADAFYFSIVTWTTLGYGDLLPIAEMRLLAAAEAVLGYVYFGIFVALACKALKI